MSIDVKNLNFSYGKREIIQNISFTVQEGHILSVLGANGVGKSTLFRCILGLLRGYQGEVLIDGKNISLMSVAEIAKNIAYIPQSHYLSFNYSVFDMVIMGTLFQIPAFYAPGKEEENYALASLDRVGILHLAERNYGQLSGGEQQLVFIARGLAQKSKILVLDEPTANLDYGNQFKVLNHIRCLAEEGYTIIQSTHNPEQAQMFSHEILALKDGKIFAWGESQKVMTTELISALYEVEVEITSLYEDKYRVCIPRFFIK